MKDNLRRGCDRHTKAAAVVVAAVAGLLLGITAFAPADAAPVQAAATAPLQTQINTLSSQVAALQRTVDTLRYSSAGTDQTLRIQTLERQVGISSLHRNSLSNLWDSLNDVQTQLGTSTGSGFGYSVDYRVRQLERCVATIRSSWSSTSAPYC